MILELIERLKEEGEVSVIMILHNYAHVFATCDRVNLLQDGVIALDKPTAETSVDELNEIVVEEYRRARAGGDRGGRRGAGAAARAPTAPRSEPSGAYALGVDFGTESGRRAAARPATAARRLAVSEVRYAHGVIDRELPRQRRAAAARLGAAAPRRLGGRARHGRSRRCSSRCRPRARASSGSASTSPRARCCR